MHGKLLWISAFVALGLVAGLGGVAGTADAAPTAAPRLDGIKTYLLGRAPTALRTGGGRKRGTPQRPSARL